MATLAHALSERALSKLNGHIESSFTREQIYLDWASRYRQDEHALFGYAQLYRQLAQVKREDALKMIHHVKERGGMLAGLSSSCQREAPVQSLQLSSTLSEALQLEHDSFICLGQDAEEFEETDPVYEHFIEEELLDPRINLLKCLKQLRTMAIRVEAPDGHIKGQLDQADLGGLGTFELDKMLLAQSSSMFDKLKRENCAL